jgi:hypothetical protein
MPQLRTRCDAHHKKALCVGQERRVVCSADGPSGTQLYIAHRDPTAWLTMQSITTGSRDKFPANKEFNREF